MVIVGVPKAKFFIEMEAFCGATTTGFGGTIFAGVVAGVLVIGFCAGSDTFSGVGVICSEAEGAAVGTIFGSAAGIFCDPQPFKIISSARDAVTSEVFFMV